MENLLDKFGLGIDHWNSPSDIPEQMAGEYRIKKTKQAKGYYHFHYQDGEHPYYYLKHQGLITTLQQKRGNRWYIWMTDQPLYWYSMQRIAEKCHGKILVIGLGLGIILHHLAINPNVTEIHTIERSWEVVAMSYKYRNNKTFHIWIDDFFSISSSPDSPLPKDFDCIVADIWVGKPGPKMRQLFNKTYNVIQNNWPTARAFYHGIQKWALERDLAKLELHGDEVRKLGERYNGI